MSTSRHLFYSTMCTDVSRVYSLLNKCHTHMRAYMKADIPQRLHYKDNERIQPIILVADEGWTIVQNGSLPRRKRFLLPTTILPHVGSATICDDSFTEYPLKIHRGNPHQINWRLTSHNCTKL